MAADRDPQRTSRPSAGSTRGFLDDINPPGAALAVLSAILVIAVLVKGRVGFHPDELPAMLVVLLIGSVAGFVAKRLGVRKN